MTRIRDGIYGLCVADALGVPAECRTREDLRQHPVTGMSDGGIRGQNVGFWSDDSSMTLCLAKSIAQVGYFHTHDIMERFRQWFERVPIRLEEPALILDTPVPRRSTAISGG